jgi:hypothetical protein
MARIAPEQAWIVCQGQTRPVVHGSVACPLRGRVPARTCIECHHLVTASGERERDRSCVADDPLVFGGPLTAEAMKLPAGQIPAIR